jgi:membrane protein DedA with SNARE-associated domain/rhodanese-related sulfurtransferase
MTMSHTLALTYPMIFLAVLANQLCLPIPSVLFLIAAGALAKSGRLNIEVIILVSVAACILADCAWFAAGRRWGYRLVRGLSAFSMDGQQGALKARKFFARRGLPALTFAKFVPGLDVLLPPIAGSLKGATVPFLIFDAAGAFFWSAAYCVVGYLFADRLDIVTAALARTSKILAILLACVLGYLLWRAWELFLTIRELRLRTISPMLLRQKLQAGQRVAVLDLLDVEGQEDAASIPGIPEAARVSPAPLRSSAKIKVPQDVQMVLCCSSRNQIMSARTALLLRRKGISNVWVLEGGLNAWQDLGLPVTTKLRSPAEVAARFGIELPN